MKESDSEKELRKTIQTMPLLERLDMCQTMICEMCSNSRPPKMSIPVRWSDEDQLIIQTLQDSVEVIKEWKKYNDHKIFDIVYGKPINT